MQTGSCQGADSAKSTHVGGNGGDPTGVVASIVWQNWGGPEATGTGMSDFVPATTPDVADGKYESVTIVTYSLGTCDGLHPAYTRVDRYFPEEGESFVRSQGENACDYFSP